MIALILLAAEGGPDHLMLWRIVNFLILGGLLGWLIRKNAGPFFAERSAGIVKDLADSRQKLADSEARARAIDDRLTRLGQEIEDLKAKARAEMAAEYARLERDTEAKVRKVFTQTEHEITAATKAAGAQLRAYTAHLAVGLAEQKITSRMTSEIQKSLLGAFARHL